MTKIVLCLLFSVICYSQSTDTEENHSIPKRLNFGLVGGVSFSNVSIDNEIIKSEIYPSFYIGAVAEYSLKHITPEIGLIYNDLGANLTITTPAGGFYNGNYIQNTELRMKTIAIEPAVRIYLIEKFLALKAGLNYSIISNLKTTNKNTNSGTTQNLLMTENWKSAYGGIILGLYVDMSSKVSMQANYTFSLNNINSSNYNETKPYGIKFGFGYKF